MGDGIWMLYIYIYMNGISNMSTGIGFCSSTVAGQVRGDDDCDAFAKLLRQNLHESLGNNALKIKKGIDKGAFDIVLLRIMKCIWLE